MSRQQVAAMQDVIPAMKEQVARDVHVRFAYLFGSQARGKTTALSDIDIAVFLESRVDPLYYRLKLIEVLTRVTKKENIDIVVLNQATALLKHEVIGAGIVLKEAREERLLFETEVLREYLDLDHLRKVQRSYIREQLRAGTYFG
jgi:predicted nucleotidyltransferase